MGKRKNKDAEHLRRKIKKLEEKLQKLPRDEEGSTTPQQASPSSIEMENVGEPSTVFKEIEDNPTPAEDELPEEFLLALGREGEEKIEVGEPIRPELAVRWSKLMTEGLHKEAKNSIIDKYQTPSNFPNAIAPQMNPEIFAILSEISIKRDKRIANRQNLIGKLMTSLGLALTNILKGNINSKMLIEQINDAAKMAAEVHFQDSSSRKFFALAGANKVVQEAVKTSKIDKFLFGMDCADKIKTAQSIQRASTQITENTKKNRPSTSSNKKQVNWKGPSQNRQPQHQQARGGPHYQQGMYKKQPQFDRPRQKDRKQPPAKFKPSRHFR